MVCLSPDGNFEASHLAKLLQAKGWGRDVDGLILAWADGSGPGASNFLHMKLFNADESEAEISGNGLCCLGQATARAAREPELEFDVETDAGRQQVVVKQGLQNTSQVATTMGSPVIGTPEKVRQAAAAVKEISSQATFVDVGNPHLVALVDAGDLADMDMEQVGDMVNRRFGDVNVECFSVAAGATPAGGAASISMKVWERGVGVTEACGSGAVAVVKAASEWGLLRGSQQSGGQQSRGQQSRGQQSQVSVKMPGGTAQVTLSEPVLYETSVEFLG